MNFFDIDIVSDWTRRYLQLLNGVYTMTNISIRS